MCKYFLNFACFICTYAYCANYYVSPQGNDRNNGLNSLKAWKTISRVNSFLFKPGDSILFESGGMWRETLVPQTSGNSQKPIVFGSYGQGARPTINGSDIYRGIISKTTVNSVWLLTSPLLNKSICTLAIDDIPYLRVEKLANLVDNSFYIEKISSAYVIYINAKHYLKTAKIEISSRAYGIYVRRQSNLHILNFNLINCQYAGLRLDGAGFFDNKPGRYFDGYTTIQEVSASNSVICGIITGNGYSHTTIKNCVSNFNGNGFYSDGQGNYNKFQNDTAYSNFRQYSLSDGNGFGIYKSSFNTIESCIAYNNKSGNGIEVDLNNSDSAIVICNNTVYQNGTDSEGYGIKTGNLLGTTKLNLVYYNLNYSNGNDPIDKMGREFYHQFGNISFYNNTAYTNGDLNGYGMSLAGAGEINIINNIIYTIFAKNNLYYSHSPLMFSENGRPISFNDWKALNTIGVNDTNSIAEDPQFVETGRNFLLKKKSPAIDKGVNIGLVKDNNGRFLNGLPDLGALEFQHDTPARNTTFCTKSTL